MNAATFTAVVPISVKAELPPLDRSTLNPVSFVELSDQARDIRPPPGVADKFVGALGTKDPETVIVV
jgi:hypothetical protein